MANNIPFPSCSLVLKIKGHAQGKNGGKNGGKKERKKSLALTRLRSWCKLVMREWEGVGEIKVEANE